MLPSPSSLAAVPDREICHGQRYEYMVGSDGRLTYAYGTHTLAFDKQAKIYMASIHARAIHDVNPRRGCSDFYGISPPFVK